MLHWQIQYYCRRLTRDASRVPAGIAEHVRIEDHQQQDSFCDDSERIMLLRLRGIPGFLDLKGFVPTPKGFGLSLAGVSIDGQDYKNIRRTGVCEREGLDRAWKTPS